MGCIRGVICKGCGTKYEIRIGGGFTNHDLHCDKCGKLKSVSFGELGEIHLRFLKGLKVPYCVATMGYDKYVQEHYPRDPITESEYNRLTEEFAGKCECGGIYTFDAKPRCPKCRSVESEEDPNGKFILYD